MCRISRFLLVGVFGLGFIFLPFPFFGQEGGGQADMESVEGEDHQEFDFSTQKEINEGDWSGSVRKWRRPRGIRYILVSGCGGGGGGAPGNSHNGVPSGAEWGPAHGGKASVQSTVMLGPLSADVYEVRLGKGGGGGLAYEHKWSSDPTAGFFSSIKGEDLTEIRFSGGAAAPIADWRTKNNVNGLDGESGPRPNTGGEGGVPYSNGAKATGPCAGGGGTGSNRTGSNPARGGEGGGGHISIVPLRSFRSSPSS